MTNQPIRLRLDPDQMQQAFLRGIEYYEPFFPGIDLDDEVGVSIASYKNLLRIMERLGQPQKVERNAKGNILVYFPARNIQYIATGFDCGCLGSGSYYLSCFGEKAGFGKQGKLYDELVKMNSSFVGTVWEKNHVRKSH